MTDLSVLFVNYNSWRFCVQAVETLLADPPLGRDGSPLTMEIIVVDNASPQADAENQARLRGLLADRRGQLIMHDENGGYSTGMNLAYSRASGRLILVSNPDVSFGKGCVTAMVAYLEAHPEAGAVAPRLFVDAGATCRLPPNILPTMGDLLGTTLVSVSPAHVRRYSRRRTANALRVWTADEPVDLEQLSGCCFLMQRCVIEQVGLFDPDFPLYYEDTDLSMRLRRAGLRLIEIPDAQLIHFYDRSGQTNHAEAMRRYWVSRRLFYRKWYGPLGGYLFDFSRWLLDTKFMHKLGARPPQQTVFDLPSAFEAPTIELPRKMEHFLVEVSMDPRFYLAAGTFGTGDRWTPPPTLLDCFGPTTYYFRICDIGGDAPEPLGVWRYTRVYPEERLKKMQAMAAGNGG